MKSWTGCLNRTTRRAVAVGDFTNTMRTVTPGIEPRLRRVKGYKHLPLLRQALINDLNLGNEQAVWVGFGVVA